MDKGHFLYNAMKTMFEKENWPENFLWKKFTTFEHNITTTFE